MRSLKIAVDFDGTCVTHEYPFVGEDIGAQKVLKELVDHGHKLILFTMRSGETLQDAINWFSENEIPLYGINTDPDQSSWTSSPKAHANIYIDDAGIGTPLKTDSKLCDFSFVDWDKVEKILSQNGIIQS